MSKAVQNEFANLSWVFGYGSLMWNPGFPFIDQQPAELIGYHRAFCIYSQHHRGTQETPGLVLGLDRGGSCIGIAYEVAKSDWLSTINYLDERELIGNYAYTPVKRKLYISSGQVDAYTYIADPNHQNYAGKISLKTAAKIIRGARGSGGSNYNYLIEVVRQLNAFGYVEDSINTLLASVQKPRKEL